MRRVGTFLGSILLLFSLWHLAALRIESTAFPQPFEVFKQLFKSSRLLAGSSLSTLIDSTSGLALALTIAALLRITQQLLPLSKQFFSPALLISQLTPKIVIFPILTILLTSGQAKLIVVAAFALFPILDSLEIGSKEMAKPLLEQFKLLGASRWQIFYKYEVRHLVPFLLSSLKVAFIFSFMGAMTVEFYKPSGLGKVINEGFGDSMEYTVGWAGIVCSSMAGMLGWFGLLLLDALMLRIFYPHKKLDH
jgi:ABC-type nitrate/sulfonate/bicarbonate transport system permease component